MRLGEAQEFASPEEALAHFGVKGMRWGVRKKEETSGRSSGREELSRLSPQAHQQAVIDIAIGTPIGMGMGGSTVKDEKTGLTSAQKNALIGLGVLAAAGAGYFAYTRFKRGMFFSGDKKISEFDVSGLKHGPLSDVDLTKGGFSEKYPTQALMRGTAGGDITDYYNIDHSKGYANYIPKNGYASEFAEARHKDLMDTFNEMRTIYPSVRNLKVEMVPMSEVPGMELMRAQGAIAAVMPLGKGEARILYNDTMEKFGESSREAIEAFVPGMYKDKYVGYHEMGHILAVANGDMPPLGRSMLEGAGGIESLGDFGRLMKNGVKYQAAASYYHKDTFKKHGFSFEELSKLGGYAATKPQESMAELFGHYAHPEMRRRLTPEQREKAHKMFNAMGGVT